MVAVLLCRELCTRLIGNVVAELRGLSLELARLVLGVHPVEDILLVVLDEQREVNTLHPYRCHTRGEHTDAIFGLIVENEVVSRGQCRRAREVVLRGRADERTISLNMRVSGIVSSEDDFGDLIAV